jgi:hypothetical protein
MHEFIFPDLNFCGIVAPQTWNTFVSFSCYACYVAIIFCSQVLLDPDSQTFKYQKFPLFSKAEFF